MSNVHIVDEGSRAFFLDRLAAITSSQAQVCVVDTFYRPIRDIPNLERQIAYSLGLVEWWGYPLVAAIHNHIVNTSTNTYLILVLNQNFDLSYVSRFIPLGHTANQLGRIFEVWVLRSPLRASPSL